MVDDLVFLVTCQAHSLYTPLILFIARFFVFLVPSFSSTDTLLVDLPFAHDLRYLHPGSGAPPERESASRVP